MSYHKKNSSRSIFIHHQLRKRPRLQWLCSLFSLFSAPRCCPGYSFRADDFPRRDRTRTIWMMNLGASIWFSSQHLFDHTFLKINLSHNNDRAAIGKTFVLSFSCDGWRIIMNGAKHLLLWMKTMDLVERNKIKYKSLLELFFRFLKLREVEGRISGIITAVLQCCSQVSACRRDPWGEIFEEPVLLTIPIPNPM